MSTQKAHCETHKTYYHSCGTCHIAEIDRLTLASAEARAEERKHTDALVGAIDWMQEDGCDCEPDEPGACALCVATAAIAAYEARRKETP